MTTLEELQKEIDDIKARNQRVAADKAWETSLTRKFVVALLTYFVVVIFFVVARLPHPFFNALIPSIAFVFSTLSMPLLKRWWLKRVRQK